MKFTPVDSISGIFRPPGDKSISHRALIMAGLAEGMSEISGLPNGADVLHTLKAMRDLGAEVKKTEAKNGGADSHTLQISGGQLSKPKRTINTGNSGTGIRLLAGVLAGQEFNSSLTGDSSIKKRPMNRIIQPLTQMGAEIRARHFRKEERGDSYAPLKITGKELMGIDYELPVASAQVKSAILLAGLFAEGRTSIREKIQTRTHTEELLEDFGAAIETTENADVENKVSLAASKLQPAKVEIPADPSAAAFWAVAAAILPNSRVEQKSVYVGTARSGFLDVLKRMGADLSVDQVETSAQSGAESQTVDITMKSSQLKGTDVPAEEIPGLIDDIPILCVAAAFAEGITRFFGAGELRHKESDRIEAMRQGFQKLGGNFTVEGDTIIIEGTGGLGGSMSINPQKDHRIAMAFAVAGLAARQGSEVSIRNFKISVFTSYPGFLDDLKKLV